MSSEEIRLMKDELQSLRNENQRLKATLNLEGNYHSNGHAQPDQQKTDTTVLALAAQLEELKTANQSLARSMELSQKVGQSFEALIPALEVQVKGYHTTIDHLEARGIDAENTYAEVVRKLEKQIETLREEFSETEQRIHDRYRQKVETLEGQLKVMDSELEQTRQKLNQADTKPKSAKADSPSSVNHPFTTLSIFGDFRNKNESAEN